MLNTDAEGRLVLADGLSLAVEEGPDAVIDVATLTGGQRVALGDKVAALLTNDDRLAEQVLAGAAGPVSRPGACPCGATTAGTWTRRWPT